MTANRYGVSFMGAEKCPKIDSEGWILKSLNRII